MASKIPLYPPLEKGELKENNFWIIDIDLVKISERINHEAKKRYLCL